MEVHEWLRELGALPALPAVAGVDEGARECDAEVDIVRASGPLQRNSVIIVTSSFGGRHINHAEL